MSPASERNSCTKKAEALFVQLFLLLKSYKSFKKLLHEPIVFVTIFSG